MKTFEQKLKDGFERGTSFHAHIIRQNGLEGSAIITIPKNHRHHPTISVDYKFGAGGLEFVHVHDVINNEHAYDKKKDFILDGKLTDYFPEQMKNDPIEIKLPW